MTGGTISEVQTSLTKSAAAFKMPITSLILLKKQQVATIVKPPIDQKTIKRTRNAVLLVSLVS